MKRLILSIAGAALIIGMALFIGAMDARKEDEKAARLNEIENYQAQIRDLKRDNLYLLSFKEKVNDLDNRIAAVKSRGYQPDRLVMRYLQIKSAELSVPIDSIIAFIERETSWANRKGMIGEVGYTQVRPETIELYLKSYGIIPQNFNADDYADFKSGMDWTYYIAIEMRISKGRVTWADWNRNGGL
jgi:hypothetical protein